MTAAGFSRLAKLTDLLQQEEQGREVACGALQKNQEDSSRRVDLEVARMQVPPGPAFGGGRPEGRGGHPNHHGRVH